MQIACAKAKNNKKTEILLCISNFFCTFAGDYQRIVDRAREHKYIITDESIIYAISLAAYNLRIRLKASVHTSVCTAFAFVSLGYARHPA